jgi:hypothetical protein
VKTLVVATVTLLCAGCTETPANCRDEVAAAFERLRTSGRPYRKDTTFVVSDQQTYHEIAEFLPPDRMRQITNNGFPGHGTVEYIWVGARAWSKWSNERGRREWEPSELAQDIHGAGMDSSTWPDRAVPANAEFECLGRVEFKGTAYIGYRTRLPKVIVSLSGQDQQELMSELEQMPQYWRTIFLDWRSALPAHDLVAEQNQLDNPRSKVQYTYPGDIKIEPPVQ